VFERYRFPSTGSRRDIRCVSGRGKPWIFVYLEWPLRKRVLTLGVEGNITSVFGFRRQRVAVFEGQRPSNGSRWDIRWVSGRGKKWISLYIRLTLSKSVLTLGVKGNTISGRVVRRLRVAVFEGHRKPSIRSRCGTPWVRGRGKIFFICN
jgi:hypothetical protein